MKTTIILMFRDSVKWTSEEIVREALDSVKAQTVPVDVISISSNSTDSTADIMREYKIPIMYSNSNSSSITFNMALDFVQTPYYLLFCPDDVLMPDYVEEAEKILKDKSIDIVSGHIERIGDESGIWKNEGLVSNILRYNTMFFSSVVRKKVWEEMGKFDEMIPHGTMEDWEFWIRCYKANRKAHIINRPVYKWRKHANNISTTLPPDKLADIMIYYQTKHG